MEQEGAMSYYTELAEFLRQTESRSKRKLLDEAADAMKRDALPNMLKNTDYQAMGAKRNFGRRKTAVYLNGELLGIYSSLLDASKKQGINYSKASECANGKRKTTGGKTVCFV